MLSTGVLHSPSPALRVFISQLPPSRLGLPVAAKVIGLHGFTLFSHHLKYVGINIHGADIDPWEIDTDSTPFSFLGTLLRDALASFSLSEDVLWNQAITCYSTNAFWKQTALGLLSPFCALSILS